MKRTAMAESAKRAILSCQPYTMLNPDKYEQWRDMEINFDPSEMLTREKLRNWE